jgi:ankyrin repeat protein
MADPNLILSSQYPIPSALQLYRIYALLTVRARWVPEAQRNEPAEIQRLIAAGVNPSTANGVGQTPLHVACLWGNHECVKVLIEAGALVTSLFLFDRCIRTTPSVFALNMALCIMMMMDSACGPVLQVNVQNNITGSTPLHCVAAEADRGDRGGRVLSVKLLLAAGADVNIGVQSSAHWPMYCPAVPVCIVQPGTRTRAAVGI